MTKAYALQGRQQQPWALKPTEQRTKESNEVLLFAGNGVEGTCDHIVAVLR